jgi:demethylmenaquinone methyltransferase/2-methoxy-6-polyprenyl-1,4-benzoquinol methylase
MHRFWKARAIAEICRGDGKKFLDVCCGTGDLALQIAHHLSQREGSEITGLDFSPNMLEIASRRSIEQNIPQATLNWVRGDAQKLPFGNDTFDGVIISFGLRNLTDLQLGINEMARVLKPGGTLLNLDLGHSNLPGFRELFSFYFRYVVPLIGTILQNDKSAYTYLPESLSTYPKPPEISKMFVKAGLQDIIYYPLALGSVALHVGCKPKLQ